MILQKTKPSQHFLYLVNECIINIKRLWMDSINKISNNTLYNKKSDSISNVGLLISFKPHLFLSLHLGKPIRKPVCSLFWHKTLFKLSKSQPASLPTIRTKITSSHCLSNCSSHIHSSFSACPVLPEAHEKWMFLYTFGHVVSAVLTMEPNLHRRSIPFL